MAAFMKGPTMKGTFAGPININGAIETLLEIVLGMTTTEQKKKWADNPPPTLDTEKGIKLLTYTEEEQENLFAAVRVAFTRY